MVAFSTLRENRLPSLTFSSSGRDKNEGAGCESRFFRNNTAFEAVRRQQEVNRDAG
jgi:hypothetical protein